MTTATTTHPARNPISWPATIWVGALHVGALLAFLPRYFSWQALAVCVLMHWFTGGIGICLCYHRLLTHRSFATRPRWFEYILVAIGCAASEGGPIGWVADHRKHHAFSDEETDVHTPHRGFWWAHMLWWLTPDADAAHTVEYYERWAPDLYKDPVLRWFDKYFILFPIALAASLYAIGGMSWLVWGFFASTVFTLHSTWLVNSATHVWGYRSHKTRDDSTNLWWVALLTYGEGWHNNHHAYQTSARHGMSWWELDMTYIAIRLMSLVGLTHSIKLPRPEKAAPADRVKHSVRHKSAVGKDRHPLEREREQEEPVLVAAETDR
jgi:fatty-acid desaturase